MAFTETDPDPDYKSAVAIAELTKFVACLLSVTASLLIAFTVILLKTYREPIARMIIGIITADFGYSILGILLYLLNTDTDLICNILSGLQSYARVASFCCACCFAHALFSVMRTQDATSFTKRLWIYFYTSIIFPICFPVYTVLRKYMNAVKNQELEVCQRPSQDTFDYDMFLLFSLPTIATFLYSLGCYLLVIKQIRKIGHREVFTLLVYPGITIICWGPYLIFRTLLECGMPIPFWLQIIAVTLCALQGVLDSLVYGFSYGVVHGYKDKFKQWCRKEEVSSVVDDVRESDANLQEALMRRSKSSPSLENGLNSTSTLDPERAYSAAQEYLKKNALLPRRDYD